MNDKKKNSLSSTAAHPNQHSPAFSQSTIPTIIALSLGFVMAMLDVTAVNVALERIETDFQAPLSLLVWVIDAYTLTFAALLLFGGSLADRLGAKRTYMLGLAWFLVASLCCAIAPSGPILVAARLLQGIGAALFMPSSLTLLTQSFPDKATRAKLLGVWGAIVGAASGVGPFIGGLLVSNFGWRSIFYVNLPLGLLGLVLARKYLGASSTKYRYFDMPSHALIVVALAATSLILIQGPSLGWHSQFICSCAAVMVISLTTLILRERSTPQPVIPRVLSSNPRFWALNGMGFLINFSLFGQLFLLSLYLQKSYGASPLVAGIDLLPVMGTIAIFNLRSGHLSNRFGLNAIMLIGLAMACCGATSAAIAGIHVSYWLLVVPLAIGNAGLGLALPALSSGVMHEAGAENGNVAAASLNCNRQIGALSGVAATGIVLASIGDWDTRLQICFVAFAICLALAFVAIFRVNGKISA